MPPHASGADDDDEPTKFAPAHSDYGEYAAPGQASRKRAFFARRDELDVIVRMLVRHHDFDPGQARALVWGQAGVVDGLFRRKGRPPKPHLVRAADVADEVLSRGEQVHWEVVHRVFVALNEPEEQRRFEYGGEQSTEPRDAENWQRAVRRVRRRLRAAAAALARNHCAARPQS